MAVLNGMCSVSIENSSSWGGNPPMYMFLEGTLEKALAWEIVRAASLRIIAETCSPRVRLFVSTSAFTSLEFCLCSLTSWASGFHDLELSRYSCFLLLSQGAWECVVI